MASDRHAAQTLVQTLTRGRHTHALFLDVDGTLLDIAPTPDGVRVPDALPALIAGLSRYLGGALALLSGRPMQDLDRLFSPIVPAAAGAHGAQIRLLADQPAEPTENSYLLDAALRGQLVDLATQGDLLVEDKGFSVAIHYRDSPNQAGPLRRQIEALLDTESRTGRPRPALLVGKMIYEVKNEHYNKGTALIRYLTQEPYAGRRPVVIGDDTTDEFAFASAVQAGGMAFSVGHAMPGAGAVFDSPEQVRQSLEQVLAGALTEMLDS